MPSDPFILVVDDDPAVLEMIATRLESVGYRVTTATDAWQEVIQAEGLNVGLIITDIAMPGEGTGVDAYRQARSNPIFSARLPFIFITGLSQEEAAGLMPDDPCVRLVLKPIDFRKLQAAIRELTGLDRPLAV